MGQVFNLEEDNVGVVLFGADELVKEAIPFAAPPPRQRAGRRGVIGRVLSPLGEPRDGKARSPSTSTARSRSAPDVVERQPVKQPLHTGLKRSTR